MVKGKFSKTSKSLEILEDRLQVNTNMGHKPGFRLLC